MGHPDNSGTGADFRLLIVADNEATHADLKRCLRPGAVDEEFAGIGAIRVRRSVAADVGYQIDSVFRGQDGLVHLQQGRDDGTPYALVFVDIRMPMGWDGIETISHLWDADPDLQVVICTAFSNYNWRDIERCLGHSDNLGILKKPFTPFEVTQLVHALTAKWSSIQQARARHEELDRLVEERTEELHSVIRQLEAAKELAEVAALQDPLTKLPNRRLLQSRLGMAIKHAERTPDYLCALLYLDIDRFKIVNDSLGHLVGDELLICVANLLESCLRRSPEPIYREGGEDIVARLGGDEFAIFLDNIRDVSDALRIADRIADKLLTPFIIGDKTVSVTVSIGVALSASHYTSADIMLRDADTAMYRAKANGRGDCVLFDESMHTHAVERLFKEAELRQAYDRHEFFVTYQPIVSLADGRIEVIEALLRWRSPSRGILIPEDFMPLAEETSFIVPIGAWALRQACIEACNWHKFFGNATPLTVGVNISSRQLSQPDFPRLVKQILDETGLDGEYLRLELTERVAMDSPELTAPVLSELQDLGVRLSINDFGTGYSSLKYLHRFSVDTLKIDQYFIDKMQHDQRNLEIVRTIVSLAHNLQMKVVAEGAETAEQVALLSAMNCDYAQGHVFAKPMEPSELASFLDSTPGFRVPLKKNSAS